MAVLTHSSLGASRLFIRFAQGWASFLALFPVLVKRGPNVRAEVKRSSGHERVSGRVSNSNNKKRTVKNLKQILAAEKASNPATSQVTYSAADIDLPPRYPVQKYADISGLEVSTSTLL
ncbi:unnamed protein product [Notodromas monacha]|uniref:Uncharacterized protein n=1 Tax=Notodromas monacha TaxID=399045 RepID=A0A7R9GAI0_9CRUS|nr:unnamed protein product [Notodromas monacha]CAG0914104.1 unnamed protein product [Notodromas monacha]